MVFFDKPPLFYWLQTVSFYLFGPTTLACRVMPALFGIINAIGVYAFVMTLYNRKSAILSSFILSTFIFWFAGAHFSNMDFEVATWLNLCLLAMLTALSVSVPTHRFYCLLLGYVFGALAFLTKGLMGLVFPCLIIGVWVLWHRRWSDIKSCHIIPGLILFVIITCPWLILISIKEPTFLHYFFIDQQFSRFVGHHFNQQNPWWYYLQLIIFGILPWCFFLPQACLKSSESQGTIPIRSFMILWAVLITVFFSIPASKLPGYIFPVFCPLAILIGHYLSSGQRDMGQTIGYRIAAIFYIILGLACLIWPTLSTSLHPATSPPKSLFFSLGIILVAGAIALIYFQLKRIKNPFTIIIALQIVIGITMVHMMPYFPINTIRSFAINLRHKIPPHAAVIQYNTNHFSLEFYLHKSTYVVGNWHNPNQKNTDSWARPYYFAHLAHPNKYPQLINDKTFNSMWKSKQQVVVITNPNEVKPLLKIQPHACILDQSPTILALINHCLAYSAH